MQSLRKTQVLLRRKFMRLFATTNKLTSEVFLKRRGSRLFLLLAFAAALGALALGEEPILRVARTSLIEGEVSYQRAGSTRSEWFDATINTPLGENDQLYTGTGGRAEIQLTGRNLVRINRDTNLKISQFTTGTTQLALSIGTATFRIESLDRRQFDLVSAKDPDRDEPLYFEVDTPTVAVTFLKEGSYRINVLEDGTTEVVVRRGSAEVYNQAFGAIPVKQGRRMIIEGNDVEAWRVAKLEDKDEWDRWNDRRNDDLYARTELRSSRYVPHGVAGLYELDYYGDWYDTPDYGWVWSPRIVTVGWAPYRSGCWRYYPSYGWTWISYEPWGWAPYHYGRWSYYRNRWCWVPHGGFSVSYSSWSWHPSLVVFFGWGGGGGYYSGYRDGYRNGYRDGRYDRVGWVPLAPGERYYNTHGRTVINNNITINNNDAGPRSIAEMKNSSAPGGITGVEGRRFTGSRVVVDEKNPPQQIAGATAPNVREARAFSGRGVELQPQQAETPRQTPIAREAVSRRLAAPVVSRRVAPDSSSSFNQSGDAVRGVEGGVPSLRGTGRTVESGTNPTSTPRNRNTVEGTVSPPTVDRGTPVERSRPSQVESSGRAVDSSVTRRQPDFRPVERPAPPAPVNRRSASEDTSPINRGNERSSERNVDRGSERRIERSDPPPSRQPDSYPRNEDRSGERGGDHPTYTPPRRVEPPSEQPHTERPEAPRERPVERPAERPAERRAHPPPERRVDPPPA